MSIYISGIDMPTTEQQLILIKKTWDGKIYARLTGSSNGWHEIIEIPPHGKLGDLDALAEDRLAFEARNYVIRDEYDKGRISGWYDVIRAIRCGDIPTIIPSSQGGRK